MRFAKSPRAFTCSYFCLVLFGALGIASFVGCGGGSDVGETEGTPVAENGAETSGNSETGDVVTPPIKKKPVDKPKPDPKEKSEPPEKKKPKLPVIPALPDEWKNARSLENGGPITDVAFSTNGKQFAACGSGASIQLWNCESWEPKVLNTEQDGTVTLLSFAPDGKTLAFAVNNIAKGRGAVYLWKFADGSQTLVSELETGQYSAITFHPKKNVIATGSSQYKVEITDLAAGKDPVALRGHRGFVTALAFSPDGAILASASGDQSIRLWDPNQLLRAGALTGHSKWVTDVAFSPKQNRLASVSEDTSCRLWDYINGNQTGRLGGGAFVATSVAYSPNGKYIAVGYGDKKVRVFDASSQKQITLLRQHTDYVNAVAFSPDGKLLATGGQDEKVHLWEVPTE